MLTPKQKKLLDFVHAFTAKNGYAPSQHEIARHFRFKSLGTVQNYLVRLERQGALRKTWNARRGVEVPPPLAALATTHAASSTVPLLGLIAAGCPIEATESGTDIEVPGSMIKSGFKHYALKVQGRSMIDDGILDGDWIVVRHQQTAQNGQTVVALLDNEATLKRYFRHADHIELRAANSEFAPIRVPASKGAGLRIEGILVGVIRSYV